MRKFLTYHETNLPEPMQWCTAVCVTPPEPFFESSSCRTIEPEWQRGTRASTLGTSSHWYLVLLFESGALAIALAMA